jgi:hypothetical protein
MPLTFHIVYVPGSVAYLLFFVESLLRWSDCSFRLVANGCDEKELRLLHDFCRHSSRLEFLQIPTNRPLTHHDALNYLQARTREETFCFMDSDIFASGPFMDEIIPFLNTYTSIFAGAPLWCRSDDQVLRPDVNVVCGEHNRTQAGLLLGGTFFAIYDNRVLTDFIHTTGVGFEMRGWQQIPQTLQPWCAAQGLAGTGYWFDTGKALNLGLLQQGHALAVLDSPDLYHLGGLSFIARRSWHDAQKGVRGPWGTFYRTLRAAYVGLRRRVHNDPVYRSSKLPFGRRRRRYGPYFSNLLTALIDGKELPALPAEDDPAVRRRAQYATQQIQMLYRDQSGQNAESSRLQKGTTSL